MVSVRPSMNGRMDCKNGILLSARTKAEPALVLMAAAPITTHKDGVMSPGLTSTKKMR
jgi:hypothetical protein